MALNLLGRIRALIAEIGVVDTGCHAVNRLLTSASNGRVRLVKYYFVAQPVVPADPALTARAKAFRFVWATPEMPELQQAGRPAAVIANRFAQGARCLAALTTGDKLAGFLWFVIGPYEEDEVASRFVPLPAGEAAWDFDVSIQPEYRLGRLFSYLWGIAMTELAAHGVRQTISRISAFNTASLASHRRLGARVVGSATYLCVGSRQIMFSSLAPHLHLGRSSGRRPLIHLKA